MSLSWPRPQLFILEGAVAFRGYLHVKVAVEALLDTGNEITIVKPEKVGELEAVLGFRIPVKRRFRYYGHIDLQPAFDLAFIFRGDHPYSSRYGFIAPSDWDFDIADVWLGQDIFSQLVITFDGVKGIITIIDPKDP